MGRLDCYSSATGVLGGESGEVVPGASVSRSQVHRGAWSGYTLGAEKVSSEPQLGHPPPCLSSHAPRGLVLFRSEAFCVWLSSE